MSLVTLEQARDQLRDPPTVDNDQIERICERATEILLDFLKKDLSSYQNTAGEPDEVPLLIEAACLKIVQNLYDGIEPTISADVKDMVRRARDPALA
jgi:acyl CoA:acetate/3-ketoacid CoA transferase alpha subunit